MRASVHFNEVPGIIGGVGPEATSYFISHVVRLGSQIAKKDQDHIPYLVFNNPQIPDRTDYLIHRKDSPVPELIRSARLLKEMGATYLVMPCNTSHAFTDEIEISSGMEVVSMIEATVRHIASTYRKHTTVGLLGTDGTIHSRIYHNAFADISPQTSVVIPDPDVQKNVMRAIYAIKSVSVNDHNSSLLYKAAKNLIKKGASLIILGCTEIPLALKPESCPFVVVDPMEILAQKVIVRTLASKVSSHRWPLMVRTVRSLLHNENRI